MNEEISRILTLVEEGKVDKEKAAELIELIQQKEESVQRETLASTTYQNKLLKVRVISEEGDNVKVNVPINLVKAILKVGSGIAERVPEAEKYVKDIDMNLLIEAIDNELEGQIVDVSSTNGDKVSVVIE